METSPAPALASAQLPAQSDEDEVMAGEGAFVLSS